MRRRLALGTLVIAAALAALAPAPAQTAESPYVPVTATERRATRPLVDVVLLAHKRGEWWRVCAFASTRSLAKFSGSRERCRTEARREPGPACRRCTYRIVRVVGIYRTPEDRALQRKAVGWAVAVEGDPRFRGPSELELRFVRERGRWVLEGILAAGSGR